jgi:dynamin 1-like protein
VGLDFLPLGSDVVTRRPLELRLVYLSLFETDKPYGVFEELKDEKFYDF